MTMRTCETCRYFNYNNRPHDGQCRRRPPTVLVWNDAPATMWPVVLPRNWCGEWDGRPLGIDDA